MFAYSENDLYCEQVPLADLGAQRGTPVYVYSAGAILGTYAPTTRPSATFRTPCATR